MVCIAVVAVAVKYDKPSKQSFPLCFESEQDALFCFCFLLDALCIWRLSEYFSPDRSSTSSVTRMESINSAARLDQSERRHIRCQLGVSDYSEPKPPGLQEHLSARKQLKQRENVKILPKQRRPIKLEHGCRKNKTFFCFKNFFFYCKCIQHMNKSKNKKIFSNSSLLRVYRARVHHISGNMTPCLHLVQRVCRCRKCCRIEYFY